MKQLYKCEKCGRTFADARKCEEHERLCGVPSGKRLKLVAEIQSMMNAWVQPFIAKERKK